MFKPLSEEQYNKAVASGFSHKQIMKFEKERKRKEGATNILQETGQDIRETGQALKSSLSSTRTKIGEANRARARGEQGFARTLGQNIGNIAGGLSKGIGDVVIGAGKTLLPQGAEEGIKTGLTKTIQKITPIAKQVDKSLGNPVGTFINNYQSLDAKSKRDVDALFGITSLAVDVATLGVGKKVVGVGARTAVGAGKQAVKGTGKALSTVGAVGEKAGKKVVSASFPQTPLQSAKTIAFKAKTPLKTRLGDAAKGVSKAPITVADVAVKHNLVGLTRSQIATKAKKISNNLFKTKVEPAFKKIKTTYNKNEIFDDITRQIQKMADPTRKRSLQNALDAVEADFKHITRISVKRLDKIKSDLAKRLPAKVWKGQDIAGDVNEIRRLMSNKMRQLVRKELPKEVRTIYDEYGSFLEIIQKGEKSLTTGLDKGVLGLTSEAIRIAGTPISTIGGKAIHKASEVVRKTGQKLLK